MAARKHPAAKDVATGQFMEPWIVRGRRIYWCDPATAWADPERVGMAERMKAAARLLVEVMRGG
jgi:hypothetical protein